MKDLQTLLDLQEELEGLRSSLLGESYTKQNSTKYEMSEKPRVLLQDCSALLLSFQDLTVC